MPVASDIEEPTTDADTGGEGLPINEVFYSLQGEERLLASLGVCADVWV